MDSSRHPKTAYIDGGMAAMLLQGAIGLVLGGLLYLKIYWRKVKAWFTGEASETTRADSSDVPPPA